MGLNQSAILHLEATASGEEEGKGKAAVCSFVCERVDQLLGDRLRKIILFGSRAREDSHKESDYDFLIVGDFVEPSWPKRAIEISKYVGYFGYAIDYLALTEEEYENKLLIRDAIKKEGVVLYERGH